MFNSTNAQKFKIWRKRLLNSRFFTISCLLHLVIVVLLGGTVLFNKYVEPPDFTAGDGGGFIQAGEQSNTPPPPTPTDVQPTVQIQTPQNTSSIETIVSSAPSEAAFTMPTIVAPTINPNATELSTPMSVPSTPTGAQGMSREQLSGIAGFSNSWAKGGQGGFGTSVKNREFEFTAYLAKYSGGDWASTVRIANGKIVAGSLPNLLYTMQKFSKDKIKANPQAEPLDLASEVIFAKKPPFIFFTGHRDFTLTPKEVENLQKYIRLGGCIWGDSSLPGQRSRFDIAFRREMRRVVPDVDKDFEKLPDNHPIFTKNLYYPEIRGIPPGLNYYKEPIYALMYFGQIAILYTPNDYGDMWQFGLNDQWKFETGRTEGGQYVAMNAALWDRRETYFRNINEEAVKATYQFGTNIVIHLLTRWEDMTRSVPKSL